MVDVDGRGGGRAGLAPGRRLHHVDLARFVEDADPEFLELVHDCEEALGRFLATKTKAQLYEGAVEAAACCWRRCRPPRTSPRTSSWRPATTSGPSRHEHLGRDLVLPGPFVKYSRVPGTAARRPRPRLGQHNVDVLRGLLGYSLERLRHIYSTGVI